MQVCCANSSVPVNQAITYSFTNVYPAQIFDLINIIFPMNNQVFLPQTPHIFNQAHFYWFLQICVFFCIIYFSEWHHKPLVEPENLEMSSLLCFTSHLISHLVLSHLLFKHFSDSFSFHNPRCHCLRVLLQMLVISSGLLKQPPTRLSCL